MRFVRYVFLTALTLAVSAGVAHAGPISFTDTFDPADVLFDNVAPGDANCSGNNAIDVVTYSAASATRCETLTYTHTFFTSLPPYNPATDTLTSATLSIWLYDDEASESAAEKIDYVLDVATLNEISGDMPAVNLNAFTAAPGNAFPVTVLAAVHDGTLNVTLSIKAGDLRFNKSVLYAEGRQQDIVVAPEPATLALFGLAAGASAIRRKRRV